MSSPSYPESVSKVLVDLFCLCWAMALLSASSPFRRLLSVDGDLMGVLKGLAKPPLPNVALLLALVQFGWLLASVLLP